MSVCTKCNYVFIYLDENLWVLVTLLKNEFLWTLLSLILPCCKYYVIIISNYHHQIINNRILIFFEQLFIFLPVSPHWKLFSLIVVTDKITEKRINDVMLQERLQRLHNMTVVDQLVKRKPNPYISLSNTVIIICINNNNKWRRRSYSICKLQADCVKVTELRLFFLSFEGEYSYKHALFTTYECLAYAIPFHNPIVIHTANPRSLSTYNTRILMKKLCTRQSNFIIRIPYRFSASLAHAFPVCVFIFLMLTRTSKSLSGSNVFANRDIFTASGKTGISGEN